MIEASLRLSPTNSYDNGYPVYFLTGKNYLYQTLFCIKSLVNASDKKFKFILVDDGSFDQNLIKQVNNQLPNGVIILRDEIDRNLEKLIPEKDFPILHRKRKEYAHIKKLTDIHTISGGWKLVFDSDMLFWNNPKEIIDWLSKPNAPLHIVDCEQSYGYPTALMKTLCKHEIPERVNVGIIGLNSSEINWEDIEIWIKELEKQGGKSYYLEQAVSAMIIAQSKPVVLDKKNYIVNPDKIEANQRSGYLHHYVDVSKAYYFANALKHF
ncbi:MAG: glycosyltransferase family 2 protein [Pedobacter sp.]|nr:MAG: glycosyltransferase family 2 protein [Pedobacter sp.]